MEFDNNAPVTAVDDNPVEPQSGAIQPEPDTGDNGQAVGDQKGTAGQDEPPTDSGQGEPSDLEPDIAQFFDPKNVPEDLLPAYKQMQAAFTSKTQAIANDKDKIQQYDNFMADPMQQLKQFATQQGYQLVEQGKEAGQPQEPEGEFSPETWDDVVNHMEQRLMSKFQGNIAPLVNSVQDITQVNIEKQLATIDPNWKLYEPEMKEMLKAHPTLAKNVNELYRFSVPENVLNKRAVQTVLKRMESKARGAAVHGASAPKTTQLEPERNDFGSVVKWAKDRLAKGQGVN